MERTWELKDVGTVHLIDSQIMCKFSITNEQFFELFKSQSRILSNASRKELSRAIYLKGYNPVGKIEEICSFFDSIQTTIHAASQNAGWDDLGTWLIMPEDEAQVETPKPSYTPAAPPAPIKRVDNKWIIKDVGEISYDNGRILVNLTVAYEIFCMLFESRLKRLSDQCKTELESAINSKTPTPISNDGEMKEFFTGLVDLIEKAIKTASFEGTWVIIRDMDEVVAEKTGESMLAPLEPVETDPALSIAESLKADLQTALAQSNWETIATLLPELQNQVGFIIDDKKREDYEMFNRSISNQLNAHQKAEQAKKQQLWMAKALELEQSIDSLINTNRWDECNRLKEELVVIQNKIDTQDLRQDIQHYLDQLDKKIETKQRTDAEIKLQGESINHIRELHDQIQNSVSNHDFVTAFAKIDEIYNLLPTIITPEEHKTIKDYADKRKKNIEQQQQTFDILTDIEQTIKDIPLSTQTYEFDQAIDKCESARKLAESHNLSDKEDELEDIILDLKAQRLKYKEHLGKLESLDHQANERESQDDYLGAIQVNNEIITTLITIDKNVNLDKYTNKIAELKQKHIAYQERLRQEQENAERLRKEAEEQELIRKEQEEAERIRKEAEEQERIRMEQEEAERLRKEAEEQELIRKEQEETERIRKEVEEQERIRKEQEEAERIRKEVEEKERIRIEQEEVERLRKDAEEQERNRKEQEEAERLRKEAEEKEQNRKEQEEAERLRKEAEELELINSARKQILAQQDQIQHQMEHFNFTFADELIQNSLQVTEKYNLTNEKQILIDRQNELAVQQSQYNENLTLYNSLMDQISLVKKKQDWPTGIDICNKLEPLLTRLHKESELKVIQEHKVQFQKEIEINQKLAAEAADQKLREETAKDMQMKITSALEKKNFIEAKTLYSELIKVEQDIKNPTIKKEIITYIKETDEKIKLGEDITGAKDLGRQKCENAQQALNHGQLDLAEINLKEAQSIVNAYNFEDLKPIIEKTQERLKLERLYERLVTNIGQNEHENQYRAGIENCKKILEILSLVEKQAEESKFHELLNHFNEMGIVAKEKEKQAQEEVKKNLEQMQTIMTVEADVLPTMEDIPIDDILGDLNGSVDKIFDTLNHVLEENRIIIHTQATSISVLRSASGEVVELQKTSKIENASPAADDPNKALKAVKFAYTSGLENPFEDAISEAILEDMIPYDYEISEMNVDGAQNFGEPQKSTTKDGLSVKWVLHDIPPKQKVTINYDLRQRVARTAIIPLDTQLKIIKTHANLSPLKLAGLYESKLTFKNEFQQQVKGLVFEDIIPQMYIYEVKRPDDEVPIQGEHSAGITVKWNVQKFGDNAKALHHYQLLEMYKFEELKMQIFKIDKDGYSAVSACDAETSYKKYDEIVKLLKSYVK